MELTKEILENYKNTPIKVNKELWENYKSLYQKHLCFENGEDLVDIKDYGIKGGNYYYNRGNTENAKGALKKMIIYQNNKFKKLINYGLLNGNCLLRKGLVLKLQELNEKLKNFGIEIIIMSGYRSPLLQIIAKEVYMKFHGKEKADLMFANARTGPHCSGGGFDIELLHKNGSFLPTKFRKIKHSMGTTFGEELLQEKGENISETEMKVIKNRRLLYHLMSSIGCTYHFYEYWHYGYGDMLSSYIKSKEEGKNINAIYSAISYGKNIDKLKKLKNLEI